MSEIGITTKERFKLVPSVYVFLIKDNKILLLRRFNTGFEDGKYGLPAGHADGGQTMRKETAREALEEAGVKINTDKLEFALTMHRWCGDHERADFFFCAREWEGEPKVMEKDKCDDASWFPLDRLPENTILYVRKAIEAYGKGEKYLEFGWESN